MGFPTIIRNDKVKSGNTVGISKVEVYLFCVDVGQEGEVSGVEG
jgi:hypothetical protein